jgi:hypothetical protein
MRCEFLGFCGGVAEVSMLTGHDAASMDNKFSALRYNTLVSSSRVENFNKTRVTPLDGVCTRG